MRIARVFVLASVGAFVAGCSIPHPLQSDVTNLPLSSIIRKITCEAKDALEKLLEDRHIADRRGSFKDANRKLKELTKRVLKPREKEAKELDKRRQQLLLSKTTIETESDAINQIFLSDQKKTPEEKAKDPNRARKLDGLLKRQKELALEWEKYNENLAEYIRTVRRHNAAFSIAQRTVDAATKEVRKQTKGLAAYYNHQMAYSFRFRIIETDALAAAAAWKLPVTFNNNIGNWTIGGSVADIKERESERNVKLVISFEDLHGTDCSDAPPQAGRLPAERYPIRGKIGVEEVIAQYFALLDRAKRDQSQDAQKTQDEDDEDNGKLKKIFAKTDAYTDSILFTTTIGGSVNPSIVLNPALREQFTASAGVSGTRKDFHSVLISLSAPDSDDSERDLDKITKVQIVRDDFLGKGY